MKRISFDVKCQWLLWLLAGLMIVGARAQTLPNDPTTKWVPMPYPTNVVSDYINDQQTGSAEGDIVGTNGLHATYSAFNFGSSPTNGLQGHRVRLGADASPAGFKAVYHVGIDGDLDGDLDIFVSVDNSGSGDFIRIFPAGNGLNISPSTTTIDSQNPLFTYAAGSSNYDWSPVTATIDPAVTNSTLPAPTNIDGATGGAGGGADHFLSFFVPFQDMVSAFNTVGITNINTNSLFRYIMATATQPNSLNQDINGLSSVTGLFTNIYNPPVTPGGSTNRAPVANPDFATTPEDVAILIPALANDTDLDTNALTLRAVSTTNGTASITGTNVLFTPATNFVGTVLLNYTISDGTVSNVVGFITVTVTPVNDPPFANDDAVTTPEDTPVMIPVLVNDGDVDGNPLAIVNVVTTNGSAGVSGTNVVFTPATNFVGVVVLTYTISDGVVSNVSATVTVNVTPVNDDPVAVPDVTGTTVNTPRTYDPRINDFDPDGDALTITDAFAMAGSVTFTGTNVVFTPPLDFLGSVQVLYTISDGNGGSSASTITFNITSGNNPPAANNDSITTPEDVPVTIPVLVNDTDPDGDVLTIIGATTTNGAVSIAGTNLVFTPGTNFNGVVVLSYVVLDGTTNTDGATVTVTVTPVNDAPVANNDAFTLAEDTTLNIPAAGVLANDADVEGDALTALLTGNVANGTLTFNANGSFTYSPATNFFGSDLFTYWITDGSATSGVATVTLTVTSMNDAPVVLNDVTNVLEDSSVTVQVLVNDSDPEGTPLVISGVNTTNGTAVISGTNVVFTPATNFVGTVVFTYTVTDGTNSGMGSVTVTVLPMNDAPVALNDSYNTPEDTTLSITLPGVLGNDTDVEGDSLTAMLLDVPASGVLTLNSDGSFTYAPQTNFTGSVSFTYRTTDGSATSAVATVTINVTPVNDAPLANGQSVSTPEDTALPITLTGSDVEGGALTFILVSGPANGVISGFNTNTGALTYTPATNFNGGDSFTFRVNDGGSNSAPATVTINVTPVNDSPVAVNDVAATSKNVPIPVFVLLNDFDPDGNPLTITLASATNGSVSIVGGTNLFFTPASNFVGSASVAYTITDGQGGFASATGAITVTAGPNTPPVANNDSVTTPEDTAITLDPRLNDLDADGDAFSITSVTTTNGTATQVGGTNVVFVPATNFNGTVTLVYTINDGNGGTASALITVNVTPVNDAPFANNQSVTTPEDTALPIILTGSDVEDSPLTFILVSGPANGALSAFNTNTGALTYMPGANFFGTDSFTFRVNDGASNSAVATVNIAVTPVNDPPVVVNDVTNVLEDTSVTIRVLVNDTDPEGTPLAVSNVVTTNGTASVVGTNVFYTPPTNFTGIVVIAYTATDGTNSGTATITITVGPVNDAPLANNQSVTTPEDTALPITLTGSDVEGSPLTFILVSGPASGVITGFNTNTGALTYQPNTNFNGGDMVTFRVHDGTNLSAVATVSITVTPSNDAPFANNQSVSTPEDTALAITLSGSDVESSPLTYILVSGPANGALSGFNTNTGALTYTPNTNYNGGDLFTFRVSDGTNQSAAATVSITVTPMADSPRAFGQGLTTPEDTALPITLLGTSPDGNPLTYQLINAPAFGAFVAFNTNSGVLTYQPATNYNGPDSFTFRVHDGFTNSLVATVGITVTPVNDPPIVVNDSTNTPSGQPVVVPPLVNDTDPDGGSLAISCATATNGTVAISGTNIIFTPASNFVGTASVIYCATNQTGGSGSGVITVSVAPPMTTTFAIGQGTNYLNPQTGLFEQRVNITNTSVVTASALRLLVGNINTPQGVPRTNVWLYNATGTNVDSRPYVLYNSPLNPGQFVTLTLEFVVPDRRPFTNSLEVIAVLPVANGTNNGNGVVVAPPFVDNRFSPARYVIEWTSIPGRTYTVIYSDDNLATWRTATPSVAAVNNRTQWYDDGPPKTASAPGSGSRFYRVILAPQNP